MQKPFTFLQCILCWWLSGTGTEAKCRWIHYGNGSISCLPVDNSPRLNTECISMNLFTNTSQGSSLTHTDVGPHQAGGAGGRQRQELLFLQLLWGLAGITCAWLGAELILSSEQQCCLC